MANNTIKSNKKINSESEVVSANRVKRKRTNEYKTPLLLSQQVMYLKKEKRVRFNIISENEAEEILLRNNYINVISPFKHKFAKLDKGNAIKVDGKHVYERDVEFSEYYNLYKEERAQYAILIKNIIKFEIHVKAIMAYHMLNEYKIKNREELRFVLMGIQMQLGLNSFAYSLKRREHMKNQISAAISDINKYHDIYCFFDRMSLGTILTVLTGLENNLQNAIFQDLVKRNQNLNTPHFIHFINKFFTLINIRNCIMHCNSLTVLVRYYNPATKDLRKSSNQKEYYSLIKLLTTKE